MISAIATAFVKAQADLRAIAKDSTNPHFKNKYASLDTIIETVRPILATHGLAVTQTTEVVGDGKALIVRSVLLHESGETLDSAAYVPIAKQDAQGAGGALTYGRRYSLAALLCLATDEDDDGHAASRPPAAKRSSAARPERVTAATETPAPTNGTEYRGAPADRPMPFGDTKDQPLGGHSTAALKKVKEWCIKKDDAKFGPLVKDITAVIAERSLGMDDTSKVERMKASVAAEDAGLPFP